MIAFIHVLTFVAGRKLPLMIAVLFVLGMSSDIPTQAQSAPTEPQAKPSVSYFDPPELPRSPRSSQAAAVNSGRLVFISGQVAVDPKQQLVGRGDFRKQADQVFTNLRNALKATGADVSDIIGINTHLVNLTDLPAYREARQAFLSSRKNPPPTSTTVQVVGLVTEGALLEVSVIAIIPERLEGPKPADPITVVAMLHARVGRGDALKKELRSNAEKSRGELGCLQYDIHRGADDPALFILYETWSSREALNDHFEMPYMKAWAARRDEFIDRREVNILQRIK